MGRTWIEAKKGENERMRGGDIKYTTIKKNGEIERREGKRE